MANQPMGAGIGLRPAPKEAAKQTDKVEAKYMEVLHKAGLVENALLENPFLGTIYRRLQERISNFLKTDEGSKELVSILLDLRQDIDWGPAAAEDKVNRLLGPALRNILKRTQAAP